MSLSTSALLLSSKGMHVQVTHSAALAAKTLQKQMQAATTGGGISPAEPTLHKQTGQAVAQGCRRHWRGHAAVRNTRERQVKPVSQVLTAAARHAQVRSVCAHHTKPRWPVCKRLVSCQSNASQTTDWNSVTLLWSYRVKGQHCDKLCRVPPHYAGRHPPDPPPSHGYHCASIPLPWQRPSPRMSDTHLTNPLHDVCQC